MTTEPIQVEVLFFAGCPNAPRAIELVRDVVHALEVRAQVAEREVMDHDDAVRTGFLGSPSIRVDGVDVEPAAERPAAPAMACRTYEGDGLPRRELIEQAIRRSAG